MAIPILPDAKWLEIIKIRSALAGSLAAACAIVYVLSRLEVLEFGGLPGWARTLLIIGVVFFGCMAIGGMLEALFRRLRVCLRSRRRKLAEKSKAEREQVALEEHQERILARLDTLSDQEKEVISHLVAKRQQSFTSLFHAGKLATLVQKGLLVRANGSYSALEWPFMVPDFVWDELLDREEEALRRQGLSLTRGPDEVNP